jgi:cytosine/adenosine deaminase-related metal-dependent hydrolase
MVKKYKNEFIYQGANSILMPAFINSHTHLEFCNNKNTLVYGNFTLWLKSVIFNKKPKASKEQIKKELDNMLSCGVGSIGAISSFGLDIEVSASHKINVVLFNEILGSKKEMFEGIKKDFKQRLNKCLTLVKNNDKNSFIPALSVHSPYSTSKKLTKWAIKIANKYKLSINTHFLESKDEDLYINKNKGVMAKFFKNSLNLKTKNYTNSMEFLKVFDNFKPTKNTNKNLKINDNLNSVLSFTHCNLAKKIHIKKIQNLKANIIHCPKSNKLLGSPLLNLKNINKDINVSLATDGLSSNNSSNIIDELKSAIFMHKQSGKKIYQLANMLLMQSTKNGAKTLGLKKGIIKKNYDSDFIIINLGINIIDIKKIGLDLILNLSKNDIKSMYLKGKN